MNGAFQTALINPNVIIDPFQVLVSANKAIHSQRNNRLITKTVHTEIIYGLSPSKNIYKLTEAETTGCSPLDAIVSRIASKEIVTV
ncbi:hypothetical protein ScPMuIL_008674 [Solemya velum]